MRPVKRAGCACFGSVIGGGHAPIRARRRSSYTSIAPAMVREAKSVAAISGDVGIRRRIALAEPIS
jgi:hypothetical protein